MSSEVIAAVIAASISFVTLIGTLAAQFYSFRVTTRNTKDTLAQQSDLLDKTFAEQRDQLDKTLGEQRFRTLNERFATAADRLGSDQTPAVQMAGVYAMAGLADDWPENQQTCVDVLCALLRLSSEPASGTHGHAPERVAYSREIRQTVIRVIAAHLHPNANAAMSWQGLNFDLTGTVFDGGDFSGTVFSGGHVSFDRATFSGEVDFGGAVFSGPVSFRGATFSGCPVSFSGARFSHGEVSFSGAKFSHGEVTFDGAEFDGATVLFTGTEFCGATVGFTGARFADGTVSFRYAKFPSGIVGFSQARFSGATVDFEGAAFSLSDVTVDFTSPRDWTHEPKFSSNPPVGVRLPDTNPKSPTTGTP